MKPAPSTRYPWGTETPGPRLRASCARARTGIGQVDAPGHHKIAERIDTAVQAVRPLVETMEHVSRTGLRVRGSNTNAVSGTTVSDAVGSVREALVAMATSSATTLSGRFDAFVRRGRIAHRACGDRDQARHRRDRRGRSPRSVARVRSLIGTGSSLCPVTETLAVTRRELCLRSRAVRRFVAAARTASNVPVCTLG